jgi:hypothetical protein
MKEFVCLLFFILVICAGVNMGLLDNLGQGSTGHTTEVRQ